MTRHMLARRGEVGQALTHKSNIDMLTFSHKCRLAENRIANHICTFCKCSLLCFLCHVLYSRYQNIAQLNQRKRENFTIDMRTILTQSKQFLICLWAARCRRGWMKAVLVWEKCIFLSFLSSGLSWCVATHQHSHTYPWTNISCCSPKNFPLSLCVPFFLSGYFSLLLIFSLEIAFNMADEDSTFYTELLVIFREYWADETVNLCWRLVWVVCELIEVLCEAPQWKLPANYANVYTYMEKIVHTITLSSFHALHLQYWILVWLIS